ncbi:MAG: hypothetical protein Q9159_002343 [Coniocarpon cinnabarinum]
MPSLRKIFYYSFHIQELRSILQWTVWHDPVHRRDEEQEAPSLRECFKYLDATSRSFAAVIKELNHELLVPICIFYLILRGLDTIEDDMTIPLEKKDPLLRNFYNILEKDGWTFDGNGPDEKDRDLLVHFDCVVEEFRKLSAAYKEILKDITKRMGAGMADYAHNAEFNEKGVNSIPDYEQYCHYVAGLVGEGLTRLFVQGGSANPALKQRQDLHESMGQHLQQTNIIRDIREDRDDGRRFWPREVWSKYVDDFDDLFKPENKEKALRCSSEMILIALRRVPDCLFYLAGLREQSVFNFAAIPQSMAIATLELCFRNPDVFQKNVKISKGQACRLMIESSQNLRTLYDTFRMYARIIHKKNDPRDPNFLKISVACGKIEQFIEGIFPSQDPNAIVMANGAKENDDIMMKARGMNSEERAKQRQLDKEARRDVILMAVASIGIMTFIGALMVFMAWMFGARFDLAIEGLRNGSFRPDPQVIKQISEEAASKTMKAGAAKSEL